MLVTLQFKSLFFNRLPKKRQKLCVIFKTVSTNRINNLNRFRCLNKKLKQPVSNLSVSTPSAVPTDKQNISSVTSSIIQATVNVSSSSIIATNQSSTTQSTVVTTQSSTNSTISTIVITYNITELNARLLNGM